ncbi:polysialyltransferase family glycosyltransferase [Blastopirellula retiformator]|uniref:polysialyltransferase family glycosyltransferase n=1 Tax=Blastopirellula retiformator TaxID=2527970 RepID=UPI0011B64466|nr:polysialyltransferase family glycosyltransferase [Blastopirellula retiformator]
MQLASAIAAMWSTSGRSERNRTCENHLLIHDLAAPAEQREEFAACIRTLAEQVEKWKSIQYVQPPTVPEFQAAMRRPSVPSMQALADIFDIHACDELYVGQVEKPFSVAMRCLLSGSRQISYGDGIALNFSNIYYNPREFHKGKLRRYGKRAIAQLKVQWKRLRGRPFTPIYAPPKPDEYRLLLKNMFDQRLSDVGSLDPELFVELFNSFATHLPDQAPVADEQLRELEQHAGSNVALLTSNFAETGRTSLDGEVDGYLQLLDQLPQGDGVALIIKPHPRDSYEKIDRIKAAASARYERTICLNDPWTFYLPFESLYAKYLAASQRPTYVASVSSACISLELLYGQECLLGFGENFVEREFVPLWAPLRQVHEADLQRIVRSIRKQNSIRPRQAA